LDQRGRWLPDPVADWDSPDATAHLLRAERNAGILTPSAFASKRDERVAWWDARPVGYERREPWSMLYAEPAETRDESEEALSTRAHFGEMPPPESAMSYSFYSYGVDVAALG
jgi:hypothetical protein